MYTIAGGFPRLWKPSSRGEFYKAIAKKCAQKLVVSMFAFETNYIFILVPQTHENIYMYDIKHTSMESIERNT